MKKYYEFTNHFIVFLPSLNERALVSLEFSANFDAIAKKLDKKPNMSDEERIKHIAKNTMVFFQYATNLNNKTHILTQEDKDSMQPEILEYLDMRFQEFCNFKATHVCEKT